LAILLTAEYSSLSIITSNSTITYFITHIHTYILLYTRARARVCVHSKISR